MLAAQGIIVRRRIATRCSRASTRSRPSCARARFPFAPDDEDIHMAVERRLTELAGPGRRAAAHRALAQRPGGDRRRALHARGGAGAAPTRSPRSWRALVDAAERHLDWPLPGYTHLQRAQPVYLGHHLLAYVWMLERDRARLRFAAEQTAALPLGAGALAGVNFDTDRGAVAAELGFDARRAQLDRRGLQPRLRPRLPRRRRDLRDAPLAPGRRARAVVHARSSASSSCPTRGRAARRSCPRRRTPTPPSCCGPRRRGSSRTSTALHGVMHALPLTYNKDLQEDKEHLFDAVDTLGLCLAAATGMVAGARFDRERMAAAASDELIAATDLADLLVKRGTPFREAHGVVAGLVREAVDSRPLARPSVAVPGARRRRRAGARALLVARVEGQRGRDVARARARAARAARARAAVIDRAFYDRPVLEVAPDLIGCVVRHGDTAGRHRRDRGLPPLRARLPRLRRG